MITITFIGLVCLDLKYPNTFLIFPALFALVSPILMVAERLA